MDNPRPEKVALVEEVRERLAGSTAVLLTEYRGLKVSELAALRRALRAAGGEYKIYKNTLARFAVAAAGFDGVAGLLEGPTAITFTTGEAGEVAKVLRDFARVNPALVIKGGLMGRSVLTREEAAALADLPSRDVLLARLAGALSAPLSQLAGLLAALPRNFAYGLKALIDQRAALSDAPAPTDRPPTPEVGEAPDPLAEAPAPTGDAPAAPEV